MLKITDVITKARLSSAYCASDRFFDELAPLKEGLYPEDLLEIFDIWQKWRGLHSLNVSLSEDNQSSNPAESFHRQKIRTERYYLDCYFGGRFSALLRPLEEELYAYVEVMLAEPTKNIRSLDLLNGVLQYMCTHHSFQRDEAEKRLAMLDDCFADLKSSLNV